MSSSKKLLKLWTKWQKINSKLLNKPRKGLLKGNYMENIFLIGMMGCGKTTVANELSKLLTNYKFVDIDMEIEKSTQKKISEIFLRHGEPFFRMLETEKIKIFSKKDKQIISVGGGAFEDEQNRNLMLNSGKVVYLKASALEIFNRIKNETHRPLLRKDFSVEKIETIMKKRIKNYEKADIIVTTDYKKPEDVAEEILGVING